MTQQELIQKYPKIFEPYEGNPYGVNWGIPDTWIQLVDDLCGAIQSHVDHWKIWDKDGEHRCSQVKCTQVKEKFGSLRFYYSGGDAQVDGMVSLAAHMSYYICIDCGSREHLGRTEGWVSTKCQSCAEKNEDTWSLFKESEE